jgi:hypothetical protein
MSARPRIFAIAIAVIIAATVAFVAVAAVARSGNRSRHVSCAPGALAGNVVRVTLANMGGGMMGGGMMGNTAMGPMRLTVDAAVVPAGPVSFIATNVGSVTHELVVLPLAAGETAGARPVLSDGRVDEAGSVGEASKSCGAGPGDRLVPGASGWVTLDLAPGRYELA